MRTPRTTLALRTLTVLLALAVFAGAFWLYGRVRVEYVFFSLLGTAQALLWVSGVLAVALVVRLGAARLTATASTWKRGQGGAVWVLTIAALVGSIAAESIVSADEVSFALSAKESRQIQVSVRALGFGSYQQLLSVPAESFNASPRIELWESPWMWTE